MSKMKLKDSKTRKKIKIKTFIYLLIIYLSFTYTFYYSVKQNNNINNEKFINFLIEGGNANLLQEKKLPSIINNTVNYLLKIDFTKPTTIFNNTIFSLNKNDDNKEITLEHNDDYSNLEELKKISSYINDPNPIDINNPIIYIYNSHQLENYNNHNLEIYGITPNVLMASYILKEKLNKLGISTIVEDTNLTELLNINNWNYNYSYKASRLLILDKLNTYNSLTYLIDLHRDSVSRNLTTTTIDNKSYAKVLFVVGLEHDNYEKNLELATDLNNLINKYYPTLSRGILKKEGPNVDGIYNQDLSKGSILIECGGVDNTIEEVFNTTTLLSNILYYYIKGEPNE